MVAENHGYFNVNNGFIPLYKDKITETKVQFGPKQPESINNNTLEVSIQPYQDFSVFARRLVFILIILQSLMFLSIIGFIYIRVLNLEDESARLSLATAEGQARISRLTTELELLRDENMDLTLDCSLDININNTDKDNDLAQLLFDISMYDRDEDEDDDDEIERNKRHIKSSDSHNTRQTKWKKNRKGNVNETMKRRNMQKRRLVCHKCKTSREKLGNRARSFDRSHSVPSDVGAAHFKGGLPEIFVKEKVLSGTIGPWFHDSTSSRENFRDFKLEPKNSSVLIQTDGFFFIYAQVYYLSSGGANSFSIVRKRGDVTRDPGEVLATCSSGSGTSSSEGQEVSCFTATVGRLGKGDRLQLMEREMNRRVLFRDGQTYFGLMQIPSASPLIYPPVEQPSPTTATVQLKVTPTEPVVTSH